MSINRTAIWISRIGIPLTLVLVVFGVTTTHAQAQQPDIEAMKNFLSLMDQYLNISGRWVEMISNEDEAVFLAVEGIVEIYEQKGNKMDAVPALREIMKNYPNNRKIRTAIQFKIRDILKDNGKYDEALKVLLDIVKENSK